MLVKIWIFLISYASVKLDQSSQLHHQVRPRLEPANSVQSVLQVIISIYEFHTKSNTEIAQKHVSPFSAS